jgi:hypothetical protein
MKAIIISSLIILILVSCSIKSAKHKSDSLHVIVDSQISQAITMNLDTLTITKRSSVFYSPDSIQISKRKKEIGEETFYAGADDYLYYMHTSYDFLDSIKLPIFESKEKKYLKFVGNDKIEYIIKLDTLPELWGVYLFDPRKRPKIADMTNISDEVKNYFSN